MSIHLPNVYAVGSHSNNFPKRYVKSTTQRLNRQCPIQIFLHIFHIVFIVYTKIIVSKNFAVDIIVLNEKKKKTHCVMTLHSTSNS